MVGIVKLALRRPYTFIVMALLIMIFGVGSALRTPIDIFPQASSLAPVSRVPINLARYVHHDREDDEERNCAHQQGVILLAQSDVEKRVNARQTGADHHRAHATAKEKAAIPCDQQSRGDGGDEIRESEADEFRDGEQQQIKQTERGADHEILERMNFLARGDFEKEECGEDEHEKEDAVFDRALDVAIRIQDRQELRSEHRL